jgi:hypothetical protein
MEKKYEIQESTVGALVAESLEREANLMPPSHHEDAEALRKSAEDFRKTYTKPVRIWREVPSK